MGRSTKAQAAADSGGPPPDKSKMLAELRAEESGHRERAAKLLEEKKALQAQVFEADRKAEAGVKAVLDGLADILPKCWGHGDNPYRQT